MIKSVLIANRGEIACRIMRTARRLGIRSVAVYSDADRNSPHVKQADEAVAIGEAAVQQSYLNAEAIIQAAKQSKVDAIHPGYGFLSENEAFARLCVQSGFTFIGPNTSAIALMGNKRAAKLEVMEAEVPCVPGYEGADQSDDALKEAAQAIGLPIMIKATAGGGGRGMRIVTSMGEWSHALQTARSEARNAFGSDELILERYIDTPRHIEIQIFADRHGHTLHLGERDCSIQRRHQKIIEESPSPAISQETRTAMGQAAIDVAKVCHYVGAGTVEFILDEQERFYFLEMNTRLQVEHPVTERVTGLDLVEWQFRVAAGEPLPLKQEEIQWQGHAIEARLYAEDPFNQFLPQTGRVTQLTLPTEGRIDHAIENGMEISPFYDPMLGKWIAWGKNRLEAINQLKRLLAETRIHGFNHNRTFLQSVLNEESFVSGVFSTHFIDHHEHLLTAQNGIDPKVLIFSALRLMLTEDQHCLIGHFQRSSAIQREVLFTLSVNEVRYALTGHTVNSTTAIQWHIENLNTNQTLSAHIEFIDFDPKEEKITLICEGLRCASVVALQDQKLFIDSPQGHLTIEDITYPEREGGHYCNDDDSGTVLAPMDGKIVAICVTAGQTISAGETLMVMEAMKMEHPIKASRPGIVETIKVSAEQQAKRRQCLAILAVE